MSGRVGVRLGAVAVGLGVGAVAVLTGRVDLPVPGTAPAAAPAPATVVLGAVLTAGPGGGTADATSPADPSLPVDDTATAEAALPRATDLGPGWGTQPWDQPWDLLGATPPPGCTRWAADEARFAAATTAVARDRFTWGSTVVHVEVATYADEALAAAVVTATVRADVGPCLAAVVRETYVGRGLDAVGATVAPWVPPAGAEGGGHTVLGLGWSPEDRREVREAVELQRVRCGRAVVTVRTHHPVEPMPGGDRLLDRPRATLCPTA